MKNAHTVHPSRQILLLESEPWAEDFASHLYTIESDHSAAGDAVVQNAAKYIIYNSGKDWRIKAVAVTEGSFESRKKLPESWRGLSKSDLDEKSGVPGGTFVHPGGFIGGNQTREGALSMALKAID